MAQRAGDRLRQAEDSRRAERHEWACFAAHQAAEKAVKLTDEEKSVIRDAILTDGIVEKGGARAVVALVQYRAKRDGRKSTAITAADVTAAVDAVAEYIRGLGRAVPARVESVWKSRARQKLGLAKAGRGGRPPSTGGKGGKGGKDAESDLGVLADAILGRENGQDNAASLLAPIMAALRGHRPLLMEGLRNVALVCGEIVVEQSKDDVRIRVERIQRK